MPEYMLTTVDNPFNPFTHFDEWFAYDNFKGYKTSEFLARIVKTSPDLSDEDNQLAINQAIEEIINENVLGLYRKVENPTPD